MPLQLIARMPVQYRCVLLALQCLHSNGWGHGDVRWPNVVQMADLLYCLIDLETVLRLGNAPPAQPYPKIQAWGEQQDALVDGLFTEKSDLYMVGAMLNDGRIPDQDLGPEGMSLRDAFLAKQLSVVAALQSPWFSVQ
jgi:hypothetical protein